MYNGVWQFCRLIQGTEGRNEEGFWKDDLSKEKETMEKREKELERKGTVSCGMKLICCEACVLGQHCVIKVDFEVTLTRLKKPDRQVL